MQNKIKLSTNYILYGKHSVLAALDNPHRKCRELITTKTIYDKFHAQIKKRGNIKITLADRKEIDQLCDFKLVHQGMILVTEPLKQPTLKDISKSLQTSFSTLVILDKIYDPQNLGAILRSCAAFGVDALIVPKSNSASETPAVAKASCGAIEVVPIITVGNIVESIKLLKQKDYWVVGMDMSGDKSFNKATQFKKLVIIFGNEGEGLRKLTKSNCDFLVSIPISDKVESLNISNSVAISLFALNQRDS